MKLSPNILIDQKMKTKINDRISKVQTNSTPIYESNDQSIFQFRVDNLDLIAKFYRLRSLRQKFAAFFNQSRADRSYRAGLRLREAGIKTPRPILLTKKAGLQILVTESCPHKALLESLVDGVELQPSTPANILALLHQLRKHHFTHGDFHARNLLIDDEGKPHLIDLDGFRGHAAPSSTERDRDRFLRSIAPLEKPFKTFEKVLGTFGSSLPEK